MSNLNIKDTLSPLFESEGFIIHGKVDLPDTFFAINEKEQYYFCILFNENVLNNIKEDDYAKLFEEIRRLSDNINLDKNCYLLLCQKIESLENAQTYEQQIFDIEEDPYFFKKSILFYTPKQLSLLHDKIVASKKDDLINYLQTQLNNVNLFKEFKENPNDETEYNLITKLFIKIPFLRIKVNQHTDNSLGKMIEDYLIAENTNIKLLRDEILEKYSAGGESIDDKELDSLILKFSPEEQK